MKLNTILQMRGKIPFPPPASGLSVYREGTEKVIRLLLKGCVNRPFYHIAVQVSLILRIIKNLIHKK